MKKTLPVIAVVLIIAASLAGCTADNTAPQTQTNTETETTSEQLSLTLDELKAYNGKDGMPAYVAYEGTIYDVSDIPQWTTGIHGGNMAGSDITEKLGSAAHGTSKLDGLTVVGKVVD
ncbi:MAG: hypothetical protein JXN65_12210 [Clostridia bacterium]|nr:hypothetical protein [Clostridia bacterium]